MNKMDGESSESVYGKFGMSYKCKGMNCRVLGVMKGSTLQSFGCMERMGGDELAKRIYKSCMNAVNVRERLPVKWKDSAENAQWREERGIRE